MNIFNGQILGPTNPEMQHFKYILAKVSTMHVILLKDTALISEKEYFNSFNNELSSCGSSMS
jgi:hypothetical protein